MVITVRSRPRGETETHIVDNVSAGQSEHCLKRCAWPRWLRFGRLMFDCDDRDCCSGLIIAWRDIVEIRSQPQMEAYP